LQAGVKIIEKIVQKSEIPEDRKRHSGISRKWRRRELNPRPKTRHKFVLRRVVDDQFRENEFIDSLALPYYALW